MVTISKQDPTARPLNGRRAVQVAGVEGATGCHTDLGPEGAFVRRLRKTYFLLDVGYAAAGSKQAAVFEEERSWVCTSQAGGHVNGTPLKVRDAILRWQGCGR